MTGFIETMAVHIRLARMGTKKAPFYRIVVADQRSPREGRFIERVGTFDPARSELRVEGSRVQHWISKGAQPSATVAARAWVGSGAGTMPSVRANCTPAAKQSD